ncbi:hypothetical protein [Natronorubrum sp. FCH18a]|uniref:hypothetical protein n=1 Tax=Natronorubrum sp. FCH18a TaxID=3447018 RepID=UPI003F519EA6
MPLIRFVAPPPEPRDHMYVAVLVDNMVSDYDLEVVGVVAILELVQGRLDLAL